MFRTARDLAIPTLITCGLALSACAPEGDNVTPADRSEQQELSSGQRLEVVFAGDVSTDDVRAVAEYGEGLSDAAAVKVKVKKRGDGDTVLVMEMWGEDLPAEQDLTTALREKFEFLADASISVAALDESEAPSGDHDEGDPEEVRQRIIEKLRADGVEGDIHVDVSDGEDGRNVEVRVTKTCDDGDCPE